MSLHVQMHSEFQCISTQLTIFHEVWQQQWDLVHPCFIVSPSCVHVPLLQSCYFNGFPIIFILLYTAILQRQGNSVGTWPATGWATVIKGFESRPWVGIFLFSTESRPALGPTKPPIQWVPGAVSPRVKRPGDETDHSLPSSAEVKNAWRYASIPHTSSWRGA
jgi:hypothetical protein